MFHALCSTRSFSGQTPSSPVHIPVERARMTDGELLQLYAGSRDGQAFAEIVRRHGAMVFAAARRLARDDAEDVTQAVFLLLAQKAGKLARYRNVAGWLY